MEVVVLVGREEQVVARELVGGGEVVVLGEVQVLVPGEE